MQTTRGSFRSFQSSWPWPTSTEYTLTAPFCSIQSVKPPVDAPTSMQTFPSRVRSKFFIAFSNFKPPRLTYGSGFPFKTISTSSGNMEPALSSRSLSTRTSPAIIMAFAFSRDVARPRSTSNTSNRFFIFLPAPVFCSIPQFCRRYLPA